MKRIAAESRCGMGSGSKTGTQICSKGCAHTGGTAGLVYGLFEQINISNFISYVWDFVIQWTLIASSVRSTLLRISYIIWASHLMSWSKLEDKEVWLNDLGFWLLDTEYGSFVFLTLCCSSGPALRYMAPSLGSALDRTLQSSFCPSGSWLSHVTCSGHKNVGKSGSMAMVLEMFHLLCKEGFGIMWGVPNRDGVHLSGSWRSVSTAESCGPPNSFNICFQTQSAQHLRHAWYIAFKSPSEFCLLLFLCC